MEPTNFDIEYQGELAELTDELRAKVTRCFDKLVRGNKDLLSATVALNNIGGNSSANEFRVRLNVLRRGGNIVAVEHASTPSTALVSALDNIERQVRELRDKRRDARKRV